MKATSRSYKMLVPEFVEAVRSNLEAGPLMWGRTARQIAWRGDTVCILNQRDRQLVERIAAIIRYEGDLFVEVEL